MNVITRCAVAIMVVALTLTSCGEDELPKIGFASNSSEAVEGNTVSIPLSVAIPSGVTPIISFSGTATEDVDFSWAVSADGRELVFEIIDDAIFDNDETIIAELTGFSGSANLGTTVSHTITINDTGVLVELTWITQDAGEADLDLILFRETTPGSGNYNEIDGSFSLSGTEESVYLSGLETNAKYAVAVEYFGGNSNDVEFTINLTTGGTINGNTSEISFNGTLGAYHIDADLSNVTFNKTGINYSGFSSLFVDQAPADLFVALTWNAGNGTPGDVDMDLILWRFNSGTSEYEQVDISNSGSSPRETVALPADAANGTYAVTYLYYSGTSNNLNFTGSFSSPGGNFSGNSNNTIRFSANYTLANKNTGSTSNISQTFVKNGSTFSNFSTVNIPVTGSGAQLEDSFLTKKNKQNESKSRIGGLSTKKEKGLRGVTLNLKR